MCLARDKHGKAIKSVLSYKQWNTCCLWSFNSIGPFDNRLGRRRDILYNMRRSKRSRRHSSSHAMQYVCRTYAVVNSNPKLQRSSNMVSQMGDSLMCMVIVNNLRPSDLVIMRRHPSMVFRTASGVLMVFQDGGRISAALGDRPTPAKEVALACVFVRTAICCQCVVNVV